MLFSALSVLALPALALAAPTWGEHDKPHKEESKHDDKKDLIDSGVFHFTSTYKAIATPDTM